MPTQQIDETSLKTHYLTCRGRDEHFLWHDLLLRQLRWEPDV